MEFINQFVALDPSEDTKSLPSFNIPKVDNPSKLSNDDTLVAENGSDEIFELKEGLSLEEKLEVMLEQGEQDLSKFIRMNSHISVNISGNYPEEENLKIERMVVSFILENIEKNSCFRWLRYILKEPGNELSGVSPQELTHYYTVVVPKENVVYLEMINSIDVNSQLGPIKILEISVSNLLKNLKNKESKNEFLITEIENIEKLILTIKQEFLSRNWSNHKTWRDHNSSCSYEMIKSLFENTFSNKRNKKRSAETEVSIPNLKLSETIETHPGNGKNKIRKKVPNQGEQISKLNKRIANLEQKLKEQNQSLSKERVELQQEREVFKQQLTEGIEQIQIEREELEQRKLTQRDSEEGFNQLGTTADIQSSILEEQTKSYLTALETQQLLCRNTLQDYVSESKKKFDSQFQELLDFVSLQKNNIESQISESGSEMSSKLQDFSKSVESMTNELVKEMSSKKEDLETKSKKIETQFERMEALAANMKDVEETVTEMRPVLHKVFFDIGKKFSASIL
jgi:DNA repair exonuclease SbcCD ATPase subunit